MNLMMAVKYLLQNQIKTKFGIIVAANACEEGLGNLDGTKAIFATYGNRIRAFVSFDGYMPQCTSCAVGSYRYRITCKTTGGHSYLDFGRTNAIEILGSLDQFSFENANRLWKRRRHIMWGNLKGEVR